MHFSVTNYYRETNLHVDFEITLLFLSWGLKEALHGLQEIEDVETPAIIPEYEEAPASRVRLIVPICHTQWYVLQL